MTGPSGEGKTTLLRLLLGLIKPQEGTASLHGGDGTEELSSATRGYFAYVPQGNSMFSGSIRSNLLLTKPEASEEELWSMLELACADQFVRELPGELDYEIGGHGKGLSEGQAQRIAIARALLRGAPILLLDEATSALDEAMEKQVLENLMNCGLIHTCIFATHRPGILRFCSKQYVIEGKNLRQISETGACRKTEF